MHRDIIFLLAIWNIYKLATCTPGKRIKVSLTILKTVATWYNFRKLFTFLV
jgi:hypothetical protein